MTVKAFPGEVFPGTVDFVGKKVNRYFYGGHLELRYPFENGLAPFAFAGGGAVRSDDSQGQAGHVGERDRQLLLPVQRWEAGRYVAMAAGDMRR